MERFADPTLFESLSFGEKTAASLVTTLMGMGVTFVVLIIIWVAIVIMARVLKTKEIKKPAKTEKPVETQPSALATTDKEQGTELVAVIMAAIAASEGSEYVNNLIVRKINRVSGNRPVWNVAGSSDCTESRKI